MPGREARKLRPVVVASLALAVLATALAPPSAAEHDCYRDPLVNVGGAEYPAHGAYPTWQCGEAPGVPVVRVDVRFPDPACVRVPAVTVGGEPVPGTPYRTCVPEPCQVVPPVYVIGRQLPGTGETYCAPDPGVRRIVVDTPWNRATEDRGVAVCANDGRCLDVATGDVNELCARAPDVALRLPTGGGARVGCFVRS